MRYLSPHKILESLLLKLYEHVSSLPISNLSKLILVIAIIFLSWIFIIYPFFLCPTRHVPGPYVSKVTMLLHVYHCYHNTSNQYIHNLHEKYGPVVSIAPELVSFNGTEAIPDIYGAHSTLLKQPASASMNNYDKLKTFTNASDEDHRRRRNRYASNYSKSLMTTGEAYDGFRRRICHVLDDIKRAIKEDSPVDIYKLFHYYCIDSISVVASGTSPNLLEGDNWQYSQDLRDMFIGRSYVFCFKFITSLYHLAPCLATKLIPQRVMHAYEAHERVEEHNKNHYLKSRDTKDLEFKSSILAKLQNHPDYRILDLTDMHISREISSHLLFGATRLAAGLTYTFWELSRPRHKNYLRRLIRELQPIETSPDGLPTSYTVIDALPWLECILREGLRLHTPSGHMQVRVVPPGGATLAGYWLPKDTEVGTPLYSVQLNGDIYEDPFSFRPERWLDGGEEDGERIERMRLAWMAFGYGEGSCPGKE